MSSTLPPTMGYTRRVWLDETSSANARPRLRKYEAVRRQLNLPRLEPTQVGERLRLDFHDYPPRLDVATCSRQLAARALNWLARLEKAWAEASLTGCIGLDELAYDEDRLQFAVADGLFGRADAGGVPPALAGAICRDGAASAPSDVESFRELTLALAATCPDLALELDIQVGDDERVRMFRARAERAAGRGDWPLAQRAAERALAIRPADAGLAGLVVRHGLRADDLDAAERAAAILTERATEHAESLVLVAALRRRRGDAIGALRLAEEAAARDPLNQEAWREVARAARMAPDVQALEAALRQLAVIGDPAALAALVEWRSVGGCANILRAWTGPLTAEVLRWRIELLHREGRFRAVLSLFADSIRLVDALGADDFERVIDAASRAPGRLLAVRRQLGGLMEARGAEAGADLVMAYVNTCVREQPPLWGEVSSAYERHPAAVPRALLTRALLAQDRFEDVLELTRDDFADNPDAAAARFVAAVQSCLRDRSCWARLDMPRLVAFCLDTDVGRAGVSEWLDHLREVAPNEPVATALEELVRRLTPTQGDP